MSPADTPPCKPDDSGATAPAPIFVARLEVRWNDVDTLNHVNNANYLTYVEESRLRWMLTLRDWHNASVMPVLAASVLNYRHPIAWPATLHVQLYCTRLGHTSITLAHRIVDAGDDSRLYCDGHVVVVWTDPTSGISVALPASVRAAARTPAGG